MKKKSLEYSKTGVPYEIMDPLKVLAQVEGKRTVKNFKKTKLREVAQSRGDSAYVVDFGKFYIASVQEGLGTKSIVADNMRKITGKTYYDQIAQDTVAAIINDLITVGAKPLVIHAYWGAGGGGWFKDIDRMTDLAKGWSRACDMADVVWGGGETPSNTGIVVEDKVDLAGCCYGVIDPKKRLSLGDKLRAGDRIVVFESSGIHANGLSMARKIADSLKQGYKSKLSDGRMYGEALLDPTIIYAKLVQDIFAARVDIHYMVNVTGHGYRKIMRNSKSFTYRLINIPPVYPIFTFMMKNGPIDEKEAYGSLNMGAGFAIFVAKKDVKKVLSAAKKHKIKAYDAGVVEKGPKQVIIEPKGITFKGESLKVRA
jgi:phosphoribosylformylglycinamidine cyclo-ligase